MIPFLPLQRIKDNFNRIKNEIAIVLEKHLDPFQLEQLNKFWKYLEKNLYSKDSKLTKICKFGKAIRTTNNVEGSHSGLNKSSLTSKTGNMDCMIKGKINIKC